MRQFVLLFILFLFSLLILEINSVYAQEPTPSATWQPLFPSPTARPTINDTCPDGQPVGWLTVTPSSRWLMNCSQCIIQPTADWSNIYTPTPSSIKIHDGRCTEEEQAEDCYYHFDLIDLELNGCYCPGETEITQTPTPIITPTQDYFIVDLYTNTRLTAGGSSSGNLVEVSLSPLEVCGNNATLRAVGGYAYLGADSYDSTKTAYFKLGNNSGWIAAASVANTNPNPVTWAHKYICQGVGQYDQSECPIFNTLTGWNTVYTREFLNTSTYYVRGEIFNGRVYLDNVDIKGLCYGFPPQQPTTTPTITTTPEYCGQVEERPEYVAEEIGLELPIPRFGEGRCIVVGGWVIDISWLESIFPNLFTFGMPESLGVPGFNLCLHPFTFGYMNLFGILLDMDVMFLLVSYIMVVRWLLRS